MKTFFLLLTLFIFTVTKGISQWIQLASGTNARLNEILFPVADTGFVAGENGTVLRTFDGGEIWTSLDMQTQKNLNDVFFLNALHGFVVGDSGYFAQTLDAGDSWSIQYINVANDIDLSAVYFTSIMTGYAGGRVSFNEGIILKTTDGGITWEITNTPDNFLDIYYQRIVFPDPDTGYALTRGMCMKTVDAGETWFITDPDLVSSGGMFSILEDAHFFSPDTGFIVGWYNPFTGYTEDGGNHWIDQALFNNQWYAIDFPSRQTGYLVGWSQLGKTTDGGDTWIDITSPLIESGGIYAMDFIDEETGYVCGDEGLIMKTSIGGTTAVNNVEQLKSLSVFPNPSHGVFNIIPVDNSILTKTIFAEVYDMVGNKILASELDPQRSELNLISQPQGVYLARFFINGELFSTKLSVQ